MARQARKISASGIYHVMQRGNERKAIFLDEEDKNKFIELIMQKKDAPGIELYAYCIMDNHVHMLIGEVEPGQSLEIFMKRVGVAYAAYYNRKHERVGHVFQDRFRSEPVEEEAYLHSVVRYIHRNPIAAGITTELAYPWSSYSWYIGSRRGVPLPPEMGKILSQFANDKTNAINRFREFHLEEEVGPFLDVAEKKVDTAEEVFQQLLKKYNLDQEDLAQNKEQGKLAEFIVELIKEAGLSVRQTAQLTGINREKIRRTLVSKELHCIQ